MMHWHKLGLVITPDRALPWMQSHAQLPTVDSLGSGLFRVYFAGRNAVQHSHVGWAIVRLSGTTAQLIDRATAPVLSPGPMGHFDEHGVFPSSLVTVGSEKWLYYAGWNQGVRAPLFYAAIGLAVSRDGGEHFERASPAPIMARGPHDPWMVTSPCVYREGARWRMHYVSGLRWDVNASGALQSLYHVKSAESDNGIDWRRDGRVTLALANDDETNIARAQVCPHPDGGQEMWYCYVRKPHAGYLIGYARSHDGVVWERHDAHAGLDTSANTFDADMMAYPNVVWHEGRRWMFYNGNRFGADGIGVAVQALHDTTTP